jgi:hypothetical protein
MSEDTLNSDTTINTNSFEIININNDCSICREVLKDNYNIILRCNHTFHASCIFTWQKTKETCPLCRAEFTLAAFTKPRQIRPRYMSTHVITAFDLEPLIIHDDINDTGGVEGERQSQLSPDLLSPRDNILFPSSDFLPSISPILFRRPRYTGFWNGRPNTTRGS